MNTTEATDMARRDGAMRDEVDDRPEVRQGTILRIVKDKGFGFLAGADKVDRFFHRSDAPDFEVLTQGDLVTFVPGQSQRGARAAAVQLVV